MLSFLFSWYFRFMEINLNLFYVAFVYQRSMEEWAEFLCYFCSFLSFSPSLFSTSPNSGKGNITLKKISTWFIPFWVAIFKSSHVLQKARCKTLWSPRSVGDPSIIALSSCTHCSVWRVFIYSLCCSVFWERVDKSSFLLCHPGTSKIIVTHFNYSLPGGSTAVLDFLMIWNSRLFLSLSLSLCLSVSVSVSLSLSLSPHL